MQPDKSALRGNKPVTQPRRGPIPQHPELLEIPGVEGAASGPSGLLVVYVSRPGLEARIAETLKGKEFELRMTGEIRAL